MQITDQSPEKVLGYPSQEQKLVRVVEGRNSLAAPNGEKTETLESLRGHGLSFYFRTRLLLHFIEITNFQEIKHFIVTRQKGGCTGRGWEPGPKGITRDNQRE